VGSFLAAVRRRRETSKALYVGRTRQDVRGEERTISEVARANRLSDSVVVVASRDNVVLVPIHHAQELLSNILSGLHISSLNEVLYATRG
jgi:hypothetical protein